MEEIFRSNPPENILETSVNPSSKIHTRTNTPEVIANYYVIERHLHRYGNTKNVKILPLALKKSEIMQIQKPDMNPNLLDSYRTINLLSILTKLFEKLILADIYEKHNLFPEHQFGFKTSYLKIQQCHRIVDEIHKSFEKDKYCTAVLLDVKQTFDKVWHEGLLMKINKLLPEYHQLFTLYLKDRQF